MQKCVCGKLFEHDGTKCYYGDSIYHCEKCTERMVKKDPDVYMKCSVCGTYFCCVHVGTDRHKKICSHCNFDEWMKSDRAKYADDTVADMYY